MVRVDAPEGLDLFDALALVCNPKTPVPLAIQMLKNVAPQQLRRLAKTGNLRMPVLQAARKLVIQR